MSRWSATEGEAAFKVGRLVRSLATLARCRQRRRHESGYDRRIPRCALESPGDRESGRVVAAPSGGAYATRHGSFTGGGGPAGDASTSDRGSAVPRSAVGTHGHACPAHPRTGSRCPRVSLRGERTGWRSMPSSKQPMGDRLPSPPGPGAWRRTITENQRRRLRPHPQGRRHQDWRAGSVNAHQRAKPRVSDWCATHARATPAILDHPNRPGPQATELWRGPGECQSGSAADPGVEGRKQRARVVRYHGLRRLAAAARDSSVTRGPASIRASSSRRSSPDSVRARATAASSLESRM